MSETPVKAPKKRYATLVRGKNYYLRDKEFVAGVATSVTDDEEAHLTEHAVDYVTVEGENEPRQKFRFADMPTAPAPARERRR